MYVHQKKFFYLIYVNISKTVFNPPIDPKSYLCLLLLLSFKLSVIKNNKNADGFSFEKLKLLIFKVVICYKFMV